MPFATIHPGLNTRLLVRQGWQPTYFDALFGDASINVTYAVLTTGNIGSHFRAAGVPLTVDYVSIDVDSIDVWLLLGLLEAGYRPRVISCEFNSNFMSTHFVTMQRKWVAVDEQRQILVRVPQPSIWWPQSSAIRPSSPTSGGVHTSDILHKTCDPATLPSTEQVLNGLPRPKHPARRCSLKDAKLLVDFPLSLAGKEAEAHAKAVRDVDELNEYFVSRKMLPYCLGIGNTTAP